jgi:hypothetical protein
MEVQDFHSVPAVNVAMRYFLVFRVHTCKLDQLGYVLDFFPVLRLMDAVMFGK